MIGRNFNQGFKSDWIIEKQFDLEGEPTGEYKIRAEIDGIKYNLSKKPFNPSFSFFGFPKLSLKPLRKDQLWKIEKVGDLNNVPEDGLTDSGSQIIRKKRNITGICA